jgi:hypothetical protein
MQKSKIIWQTLEYEPKKNSSDWFWVIWIIAASMAIIAFIYDNPIFAALIIVSVFTLSIYSVRKPRMINFEINHLGIKANKQMYLFSTLKSFWIETENATPKIIFKSNKIFSPYLIIPLNYGNNVEVIEKYLSQYLKKDEVTEPMAQKIMEYLGF